MDRDGDRPTKVPSVDIYINVTTCQEKKSSVGTKIIAAIYTKFSRKKSLVSSH